MEQNLIQVALDKDLINKLLKGLYNGAEGKALKVVIDTGGKFHVNSKGLVIVVEGDAKTRSIKSILVENDRMYAVITYDELKEMRLDTLANNVYQILGDRYSPYFHSLSDNVVVFSRAYDNS